MGQKTKKSAQADPGAELTAAAVVDSKRFRAAPRSCRGSHQFSGKGSAAPYAACKQPSFRAHTPARHSTRLSTHVCWGGCQNPW